MWIYKKCYKNYPMIRNYGVLVRKIGIHLEQMVLVLVNVIFLQGKRNVFKIFLPIDFI